MTEVQKSDLVSVCVKFLLMFAVFCASCVFNSLESI